MKDSEVVGGISDLVTTENVGSNPSKEPPEGCVTSAEDAYLGTGEDTTERDDNSTGDDSEETEGDELPNTISITGGSATTPLNYEFNVTERIEKSTARNATIDPEDTISDGHIEGVIAGGTDSYEYAGQLTDFFVDGEATVYVNGTEVDQSSIGRGLPNEIIIDGSATPRRSCRYSFAVDGTIEKSADLGSINSYDTVSDGKIEGRIIGGKDAYRFSGALTQFDADGPLSVIIREQAE